MRHYIAVLLVVLSGCAASAAESSRPAYENAVMVCSTFKCTVFTGTKKEVVKIDAKLGLQGRMEVMNTFTGKGWEPYAVNLSYTYFRRTK
jgi:hypothetical protein